MRDADLLHNAAATARLRELVARLSNDNLRSSLGDGWTVLVALAHLAFWDARQDAALRQYSASGVFPADANDDAVNTGVDVLGETDAARSLAVRLAEHIDSTIAALTPDHRGALLASVDDYAVRRQRRREQHIAQIQATPY